MRGEIRSWFKVRFLTGFFVTVPVVLTAWVLWIFFASVDDFMSPLYEHLLGRPIPGLGFLSAAALIFMIGVFATNVVGRRVLLWGERLIGRVPLVRRVYPTVKDFVDHIDYAVKLIGIDHVGISSDFDGGGGVEGWSDASETFNVTLELVRRGYTEPQIAKLWSGNLLRVMADVERIGREIQASRRGLSERLASPMSSRSRTPRTSQSPR